jgi:hypothetical protein
MRKLQGCGVKPFDANGHELDAVFTIELSPTGFDLLLESRGGSDRQPGGSRNKDYAPALTLLLERMAGHNMLLQDAQIASTRTVGMLPDQRRLNLSGFSYPIMLSTLGSANDLRLEMGRASAAFGRTPGKSGGNPTKRLRLSINWLNVSGMSAADLEAMLALPGRGTEDPQKIWLEAPTDDPVLLEARVRAARSRMVGEPGGTLPPPPPGSPGGQQTQGTVHRFVRDPNVIAWVLLAADGVCEACDSVAPFTRPNGDPFLEVHHVRPLAEGGPDTVDNAVAICPNCHRELHHGADREVLRKKVIAKIKRLSDYPIEVLATYQPDDAPA